MDRDERLRSAYQDVLKSLYRALSWLERPPADGRDAHDPQRSAMFHLGKAGGLAFSGLLPGIGSEALFDEISDAAENRDLDHVGRIRRVVAARLTSDPPPVEPSPGRGGLALEAGYLQMLAVLNEAREAQKEGDSVRYSLMAGFLVGLMPETLRRRARYHRGSLKDAVLAALDQNPQEARAWVLAESIVAREERGLSQDADPRIILLNWVRARLAAGHRLSCPTFFHSVNETKDQRRAREAEERAYHEREEASIQRAQNFGKRIATSDGEDIWVPMSYSLNRALVLDSHEDDTPADVDREE